MLAMTPFKACAIANDKTMSIEHFWKWFKHRQHHQRTANGLLKHNNNSDDRGWWWHLKGRHLTYNTQCKHYGFFFYYKKGKLFVEKKFNSKLRKSSPKLCTTYLSLFLTVFENGNDMTMTSMKSIDSSLHRRPFFYFSLKIYKNIENWEIKSIKQTFQSISEFRFTTDHSYQKSTINNQYPFNTHYKPFNHLIKSINSPDNRKFSLITNKHLASDKNKRFFHHLLGH